MSFREAFDRWVTEFRPTRGRSRGLIGSQLYRHFREWTEQQGWEVPEVRPYDFGHGLHELGLYKVSVRSDGRYVRPYMLSSDCAQHFRLWEESHPLPPLHEAPLTIRRADEQAADTEPAPASAPATEDA